MSRLRFSREHRLTERPDFVHCYDAGWRFFSPGFVLFAASRGGNDFPWRLGLAVTKKTGNAVTRNRVRRLIREVFRLEQQAVPTGFDLVVVPKRVFQPDNATFESVKRELTPLLDSLAKKAKRPSPSRARQNGCGESA